MASPYLSEIRMMSFNFPPSGWALCNGQTLSVQQNQALFSLIGTTYGGDGLRTFQLPNLQGRVPIHMGNGFTEGQLGGEVSHTLTVPEMPLHLHTPMAKAATDATSTGLQPGPAVVLAEAVTAGTKAVVTRFGTGLADTALAPNAVATSGSSQPHPNQQPFTVVSFCIAMQGIFPSRS